jgi:ABC-2 type transport system ATP-binding protein
MNALTIKNLYKTYPNGTAAVKGVDLEVKQGDFFCLLGPNGAGKSTIIGIVSSLINKTSGMIKIFDYDLEVDLVAAKSCMGLVPQELNFNQFENVLDIVINQAGFYGIPYKLAYARAEKYLHQLGLWHKRHDTARSLSGGMKRRLMIARALVHEPRLLILDEPTAGVDIELRRATWDFLREINNEGVTIILTTHYLEEAEFLCNGIAIINHGIIIERTLIKDLLQQLPYETIMLDLQTPISATQLPAIANIELRLVEATTIEAKFTKQQTLNDLFAALSQQGVYAVSMRNKANRLEELFLDRIKHN